MKHDFTNLNIEPMPNPKPLKVMRVQVGHISSEGKEGQHGTGLITNANLHPHAIVFGRW